MNVYDAAHQMAKALKESDECKKMMNAKAALSTDAEASKMVKDFLAKQIELEIEVMSGKPVDPAKQENLQKLFDLLSLNEKSREYMQAYTRFQIMMKDIEKIIGEAVRPILSELKDE